MAAILSGIQLDEYKRRRAEMPECDLARIDVVFEELKYRFIAGSDLSLVSRLEQLRREWSGTAPADYLSRSLDDLGVEVRQSNAWYGAGVSDLDGLLAAAPRTIKNLPNMGAVSVHSTWCQIVRTILREQS